MSDLSTTDLCAADTPDDVLLQTCVRVARRKMSEGYPLELFFQWRKDDLECKNRKIRGSGFSSRLMYRCPPMGGVLQIDVTRFDTRLDEFFLSQSYDKSAVYVFVKDPDSAMVGVVAEWTKFNLEALPGKCIKFYGRMAPINTFSYRRI